MFAHGKWGLLLVSSIHTSNSLTFDDHGLRRSVVLFTLWSQTVPGKIWGRPTVGAIRAFEAYTNLYPWKLLPWYDCFFPKCLFDDTSSKSLQKCLPFSQSHDIFIQYLNGSGVQFQPSGKAADKNWQEIEPTEISNYTCSNPWTHKLY